MTVNDIRDTGRDLAHVTAEQVPDATTLKYLNIVYHDFSSAIRQRVGEDVSFDIWYADAIEGQREYPLPTPSETEAGIATVKAVYVKARPEDTDYRLLTQADVRSLAFDWDEYDRGGGEPMYYLADNSIFLSPNFDDEATGGAGNRQIKILGTKREVDLVAGGAEATIAIPREYHSVIVLGLKAWCEKHVGKNQEGQNSDTIYENAKNKATQELSDRDTSMMRASIPSDLFLQ